MQISWLYYCCQLDQYFKLTWFLSLWWHMEWFYDYLLYISYTLFLYVNAVYCVTGFSTKCTAYCSHCLDPQKKRWGWKVVVPTFSEEQWVKNFHMSKETFLYLCQRVFCTLHFNRETEFSSYQGIINVWSFLSFSFLHLRTSYPCLWKSLGSSQFIFGCAITVWSLIAWLQSALIHILIKCIHNKCM